MEDVNEILKLVTNNLDRSKRAQVAQSVNDDEEKRELYKRAKYSWALISTQRSMPEKQVRESFKLLNNTISQKKSRPNLNLYLKYAAMLLLFISLSVFTYFIGRNTVTNNNPEQYTTVIAEKGQISKIILPDGTAIWLNSGSTLQYNSQYGIDNRDMRLSGQAYFDVSKNKQLLFIVSCRDIEVKALGTKFDISCYPDELTTSVVLETGSVELAKAASKQPICRLNPGERAVFDGPQQRVAIAGTNVLEYTNWKSGMLTFHDAPMDEVIRTLSRKYDIEVEVKNPKVYKSVFTGKFKNESLDNVVDLMEFTCKIKGEVIREGGICTKLILE